MKEQYDLFKKLKDSGFPQKGKGTLIPSPDCLGGKSCRNCFVYIPTLEEIVDAMPSKIKYHPKLVNGAGYLMVSKLCPNGYRVYYESIGELPDGPIEGLEFKDESLKIALVNLFLALNPK